MRYQLALFFVLAFATLLAAGCVDDSQTAATTRPSDAALADPAGYHPTVSDQEMDISGGSTNHLDKNALKKDWDDILNP